MNQLISDLLDFARSQHAAIPIKPATCELREIAADVIAEFKLAEPDVDIRVEPQSGCEGQWDRARMAQVFQNLIGNAIQHGVPDTPITVQIGCDAERVWARVENRGTLATDERHRIFEPFRSHPSSKGLGLGLYIARAIVEAHGGTIAVDSNAEWTSFLVTLPLHAKPQPKTHRSSEFRPLA